MRARRLHGQRGQSLALALVVLVAVSLLALAGARNALLGEKASRNDLDRQQALSAAEAALRDAEAELLHPGQSLRAEVLAGRERPLLMAGECAAGAGHPLLGICLPSPAGSAPAWLRAGLADSSPHGAGVPYGQFSRRTFPHGAGPLPAQMPRYLIEMLESGRRDGRGRQFRITAIGFGASDGTQAVLQSWIRISADGRSASRLAWRELTDWRSDERNEQ